jgi:alkylhydroperoxidase family enzyme
MHNPDTLPQFLDYWVNAKNKMGFSVREQELVILRMAALYKSNYVWKHHIPVAMEFGTSMDEIENLKIFPLPELFNPRETAILILTDSLVNERNISDQLWDTYHAELKHSEIIDLISLVSQYVLFALVNNVVRVRIEDNLSDIPGL